MENDKKLINSHIQMPEFLLKRFENEDHQLYCYDVTDGKITTNKTDSINTETAYFSETTEKTLNHRIEQPFSSLLRYIDRIDFDSPSIKPKRGHVNTTRTFMNALLARSPVVFENIERNSVYMQFFDQQSQHDLAVMAAIDEAKKLGFFDEYYPTFTVNKTNIPFVLPICGFYWFNQNKNINLPIGPHLAITIVNQEMYERLFENNKIRMYLITKESEVNRLNHFAYLEQKQQGYGSIISGRQDPLKNMLTVKTL